jgi:hypothetical protein
MRFAALLLVIVFVSSASALPPMPAAIKEALHEKAEYKAYLQTFAANADKCASCHIPKMKKDVPGHALNDFGKAFHDNFDDDAFKAAAKAKELKKTAELFTEAWDKTLDEKNEEGIPFRDLVKEGKLPGKNPPAPAAE